MDAMLFRRVDPADLPLERQIALARAAVSAARDANQRGSALNDLGSALAALGERETGSERLEEAIAVFRAALNEWSRESVPLKWAMAQNNLGNTLAALAERESGSERFGEAITAFAKL